MKLRVPSLLLTATLLTGCDDAGSSTATATDQAPPESSVSITPLPAALPLPSPELLPLTQKIRARVSSTTGPATASEMQPYEESIPEFPHASITMIPLPAGTVTLGSPDTEAGRRDNEGPRRRVALPPFWIASTEVTWALYREFMQNGKSRNKDGTLDLDSDIFSSDPPVLDDSVPLVDVISQPTPPYNEMHFSMGQGGYHASYPAISLTQHAASKFCEWLTAHTGHYYRLPTEAEWEYAARAGTTTAYSFGDDPATLGEHAWFAGNGGDSYHPVGAKKPNAWGLFDMHGNAAEWVLDGADDGFRQSLADGTVNPWAVPANRYPRLVKGGSWLDPADKLRVAAREVSTPMWKAADPQVPKSVWYLTNGEDMSPTGYPVGFRVVRPLHTPTAEEMHLSWNTDWWSPERNAEDL